MKVEIAQCPVTWGIERPDEPANPGWEDLLEEIGRLGYAGLELGPLGYFPEDEPGFALALERRALHLCAGYLMEPLTEVKARPRILRVCRRTCETLARRGARILVLIDALCPGPPTDRVGLDARRLEALVETADEVARIAADHGLRVAFHPHVATSIQDRSEIDQLFAAVDPSVLGLCLDSGHSAYAGIDPAELASAYPQRIWHLHLKDVNAEVLATVGREALGFEEAVARGVFCPLGDGAVDFEALFAVLAEMKYAGWAAVEQDRHPLNGSDAMERASVDAARSLSYLNRFLRIPETGRSG